MAIALRSRKPGHQDVRPVSADYPDHVSQSYIVTLPLLEGFVGILGKSKIRNPGEALLDAIISIGLQQFEGSHNSQHVEQIAAYLVLPALAAIQRQQEAGYALSARLQR